jgi:competence protein ComEC
MDARKHAARIFSECRRAVSPLGQSFAHDRERWLLWAPVAFGTGIGVYFGLKQEPAQWLSAATIVILLFALWATRGLKWLSFLVVPLLLMAAGFAHIQWRTNSVAAPVILKKTGSVEISGRVIWVENFAKRPRVQLDRIQISRMAPEEMPKRVRIRLLPKTIVEIGETIRLRAILLPPSAPLSPGGFNFQRKAWFEEIGGVGFAISRLLERKRAPPEGLDLNLKNLRLTISTRIKAAIPGEVGAVIAALIVGDRSALSEPTLQFLRDAGLAHLLAISGLHIGLVATTIFFAVRLLLVMITYCALRWPIKKIAAFVALAGSFIYLLIAGATVPTQRAFLMTGLVLIAIMADRRAISLRLVAAAAMVVLLYRPESTLSPSFQMSFAAVVALVAFYEGLGPSIWQHLGEASPLRRFIFYLLGLSLTTIIATVATGLIALHHFGRIPHFGLVANLIAVPLTAFWIMPWAVLSVVLMPLGLENFALEAMGWGVGSVIAVAEWVSNWPNAVTLAPLMPTTGLIGVTLGGIWICLWTGRKRWIGLAGVFLGVCSIFWLHRPDILISENGTLIAVRTSDGNLALSTLRREKFTAKLWLQANGQQEKIPFKDVDVRDLRCDALGCLYKTTPHGVALIWNELAFQEECGRNKVIVSTVPVPRWCKAKIKIGRFDLWRNGAHALWLGAQEIRVENVRSRNGARPWMSRH